MTDRGFGSEASLAGAGILVALVCATAYGLIIPFSRFSYDYGVNPATAVLFRLSFAALAASALVVFSKRSLFVPRQGIVPTLVVTLGISASSLCYNSAVAFIPVSFTVLIVYTYPLMIATYAFLMQRAALGILRGSAFLIAFAGMAMALGPSFQELDWRGVFLAVGAAVSIAGLFIAMETALRHSNVTVMVFYANLGSIPVMIGYIWFFGSLGLPTGDLGWVSLLGAAAFYVLGISTNLAAIRIGGPARTALILNLEPIVAMVAAAWLLGEHLTVQQYLGGALVIGALMLSAWADLVRRSPMKN